MNIELKDFIKETLVQIIEGVKAAQEETKTSNAEINAYPAKIDREKHTMSGSEIRNVEFDIAITTSKDEGAKARIGVVGGLFGGAAGADISHSNANQNRIKFSVPIQYTIMRKNITE
jgi:hypothetical protein